MLFAAVALRGSSIAVGQPPLVVGPELLVTTPFIRMIGQNVCAPLQKTPDIAWNGENYLITWSENDPTQIVYAERFSGSQPLDGRGFRLSDAPLNLQIRPAVASDGQDYLVVWVEQTPEAEPRFLLKARLVGGAGGFKSGVILLSDRLPEDAHPAVSWGSGSYLIVWEFDSGVRKLLVGNQITASGIPTRTQPFPISELDRDASSPSLVWNGLEFLVIWTESDHEESCPDEPCPFVRTHIRGARITAAGAILSPAPIAISDQTEFKQSSPDVAWNGVEFLVVWSRADDVGEEGGIRGRRYDAQGRSLDGEDDEPPLHLVSNHGESLLQGRVASDGTGFLIVWSVDNGVDQDLWSTRVSSEGLVLDTNTADGNPVAIGAFRERTPAIHGRTDGLLAVTYSRTVEEGTCGESSRIFLRYLGDAPTIPPPAKVRTRPVRK